MIKFFKIVFCLLIVNFFYFPTPYTFTYGFNTKELIAVVGIFLFLADMYRQKSFAITREFLDLLVYSILISIMAIFSAVYHNTPERVYTTYFLSMLVWLSSAFVVIKCIKLVHGHVTIPLVGAYIVAISVIQGLIAVIADNYPPLDNLILRTIPGITWCKSVDRLYGFSGSATLDTGGIRFAIASILCMHNIKSRIEENKPGAIPLYILAFLIITVTGNLVARTTLVGTVLGLVYLLVYILPLRVRFRTASFIALIWLLAETAIIVLIVIGLYNNDEKFRFRTRFGFEGFFALAEEGRWRTGSNDQLADMYVFPDNPETWLIGDGYFGNPEGDLNYLGDTYGGYYKNTDVGYLRFIFFFGIIGLIIFSMYIIYAGRTCNRMLPGNTLLFLFLTATNFIVWFKVATDCFFILGLFICLGYVISFEDSLQPSSDVERGRDGASAGA